MADNGGGGTDINRDQKSSSHDITSAFRRGEGLRGKAVGQQ